MTTRIGSHYYVETICRHCGQTFLARRDGKGFCSRKCGGYSGKDPLLERVDCTAGPLGCWPWLGTIEKHGYGRTTINRRHVLAHRAVYQELIGPIPPGLDLLHSCDNPVCCNPNHLSVGTHDANMADMSRKGRSTRGRRRGSGELIHREVRVRG